MLPPRPAQIESTTPTNMESAESSDDLSELTEYLNDALANGTYVEFPIKLAGIIVNVVELTPYCRGKGEIHLRSYPEEHIDLIIACLRNLEGFAENHTLLCESRIADDFAVKCCTWHTLRPCSQRKDSRYGVSFEYELPVVGDLLCAVFVDGASIQSEYQLRLVEGREYIGLGTHPANTHGYAKTPGIINVTQSGLRLQISVSDPSDMQKIWVSFEWITANWEMRTLLSMMDRQCYLDDALCNTK